MERHELPATSFTTMTRGECLAWARWARTHDWGRTAYVEQAFGFTFITITDREPADRFGGGHNDRFIRGNDRPAFSSSAELREWAGY